MPQTAWTDREEDYMRKLCGLGLLILALLFPLPAFAAGQEKKMGTVQFQCMVDLSLDGQTMELVFEEQDTGGKK